jgi:hypothetical protein
LQHSRCERIDRTREYLLDVIKLAIAIAVRVVQAVVNHPELSSVAVDVQAEKSTQCRE